MQRTLRIIGVTLLVVAGLVIVTGHVLVWVNEGFGAMTDLLSPHNITNTLSMLALLAPGFVLIWLSDRMARRKT